MPLSMPDRIAFSAQILTSAAQIAGVTSAQNILGAQIAKVQTLDTANKNLFDPVNVLITQYQQELTDLDGNGRTTIVEQDIQNAAGRKFQNHFFPNDTVTSVPSIASLHNVWPRSNPYALSFGLGKNYSEAYTPVTKEGDIISAIQTLISSLSGYTDQELTTGQTPTGTCTIVMWNDQIACSNHGGSWTPGSGTSSSFFISSTLFTMKTDANNLVTFLNTELTHIVSTDTTSPNHTQNIAAANYINSTFLPALSTWLALPDFENSGSGPSKLHSTQLSALSAALSSRLTFIATRISQLNTTLGTVVQDISTGDITSSSGYYGSRYSYLNLRLNAFNGSTTQLVSAQGASSAQTSIKANIASTTNIYSSFLPTSGFKAPGNGTTTIHLLDSSFVHVGDTVYIIADNQDELLRAIKSVSGDTIVLNDVVPAKYSTNARLYKDLT